MILCFIADARSMHTQRWVQYFGLAGHEVHLITYDPMNRVINGVTEHVLVSRWNTLYLSFIPRHLAIKRLVKKIKPDLIHAHFIAKYGFHLPDLKFRPSVVSAWGDDVLILPQKSRLIRYYTKKVLASVDHRVRTLQKRVRRPLSIPLILSPCGTLHHQKTPQP